MNDGYDRNFLNNGLAPMEYDQDQFSDDGSMQNFRTTQPFDGGFGYEDIDDSETEMAPTTGTQFFHGNIAQDEQYFDCDESLQAGIASANQAPPVVVVTSDDDELDEDELLDLDDTFDSDLEERTYRGSIQAAAKNFPEVLALQRLLQELQNEFKEAEQENKKAAPELAELQKLLSTEIEEVVELKSSCEEATGEMKSEAFPSGLEDKYKEIEDLLNSTTEILGDLDTLINHVDDGNDQFTASAKEHNNFFSQLDEDNKGVISRYNKLMERSTTKIQEMTALKKAADDRFAAEINDYDVDIKAMKVGICDAETAVYNCRTELESLKHELAKASVYQEDSEKRLNDAKRQTDNMQGHVNELLDHSMDEAERFWAELASLKEKKESLLLEMERFRAGQSTGHEELAKESGLINVLMSSRDTVRQNARAVQGKSDKDFASLMAQSEEMNIRMRDLMEKLNDVHQLTFSERLDFDYTMNKSQLDFTKATSGFDENLKSLTMVISELKHEEHEGASLKSEKEKLLAEREKKRGSAYP